MSNVRPFEFKTTNFKREKELNNILSHARFGNIRHLFEDMRMKPFNGWQNITPSLRFPYDALPLGVIFSIFSIVIQYSNDDCKNKELWYGVDIYAFLNSHKQAFNKDNQ